MEKVKCTKPFKDFFLRADGSITACCYLDDYTYGNIRDLSLEDAASSNYRLKLIGEFESGDIQICKNYIENCKCNSEGFVDKNSSIQIETIEMALSGTCNLRCPSCHIWKMVDFPYDKESFYDSLSKMSQGLKKIIIHGGEPFIQRQTFKIFDFLNELNNKIKFEFITNGNWSITKKLSDIFGKPVVQKISFSIDTLETETYGKLRLGGSLSKIFKNLNWFFANNLKNKVELSMVVQLDNYKEVLRFIDYCHSQEVTPKLIFLISPSKLSLRNLSIEKRVELMRDWINYLSSIKSKELYECLLKLSIGVNKKDFFELIPSIIHFRRIYER